MARDASLMATLIAQVLAVTPDSFKIRRALFSFFFRSVEERGIQKIGATVRRNLCCFTCRPCRTLRSSVRWQRGTRPVAAARCTLETAHEDGSCSTVLYAANELKRYATLVPAQHGRNSQRSSRDEHPGRSSGPRTNSRSGEINIPIPSYRSSPTICLPLSFFLR